MLKKTDPFSEDDLLAFMRGDADPDLSQRIEAATAEDPALRAEMATMQGISHALKNANAGNPPGEFGWRKLEAAIRQESAAEQRARPAAASWWRAAAVFLGLAVLGQGTYIAVVGTGAEDAAFSTASQSSERQVLGIGFAPGTDIVAITALLRQTKSKVIDGPGALGIYRVAFASEDDLQAARALFETSDIVELVADE